MYIMAPISLKKATPLTAHRCRLSVSCPPRVPHRGRLDLDPAMWTTRRPPKQWHSVPVGDGGEAGGLEEFEGVVVEVEAG